MKTENPLVLLLGNYRPSLVVARTFKKRGFDVAVGSHGCDRLCQYSNAVSFMWEHSTLDTGPKQLANELLNFQKQHPALVGIIPVAEEYVRLIAEHEAQFEGLVPFVTMASGTVQKCLDKEFMLKLSRKVSVPTAPFGFARGFKQVQTECRDNTGYPVIIRPVDSTRRINGNKAIIVENEQELKSCFETELLEHHDLLLQRKFEGRRHNVYFAAINGKPTRLLHALILRTDKPDDMGLAVEGITLDTGHPLILQTKRLLMGLNYNGIGCAQFLVNQETGESSFLEINPRIAGNHALPEYAGLDLAWFNFDRVVHCKQDTTKITGAANIRYCWTSGDLEGAKKAFLRGEISGLKFVAWILKGLLTATRSHLHMVFDIKDPAPAAFAFWNLLPRIARWKQPDADKGKSTIYSGKPGKQGKLA